MIAEFGQAIGRNLKSVADHAWTNGDPPKGHIDLITGYPSAFGYVETLIHVRAMDIASGFLRIKKRPFYPNFDRQIHFESRNRDVPGTDGTEKRIHNIFQYLNRLDDWCQKLENIRTSMRLYEMNSTLTLPPLPQGATQNQAILHTDVCFLANHWVHESTKTWLKTLCMLDGVAFHIRVLCYHGGVEQMSQWKRLIKDRFNNLGMKSTDEAMKKLRNDLSRWKQAFANAVAISPLLLITGQGFGQMLNTPNALRVIFPFILHI
ncbi:hypothetical protein ARMSODRAFT_430394 [Armillaria solidipes]|uniref:Uncharacterized protein n=1 Tax=Armillaria solidipes TaxID=1076256 RepID=A0A2H3B436_9AGAR|nr:hypothetical protein ARMSODRAFT_430394 [Armillaria solidipes]